MKKFVVVLLALVMALSLCMVAGAEDVKDVIAQAQTMTLDDLTSTQKKWIKGRTYVYGIVGDSRDLDMDFLSTLGPVKVVSLEEIFGY